MKTQIFLLAFFIFITQSSCEGKNKSSIIKTETKENMDTIITNYRRKYDPKTGLEVYDFETVEKSKTNPTVVKTRDDWTIVIGNMTESGAIYNEYPSGSNFHQVQKLFYPNGQLKQEGAFYLGDLTIGIWKYYDEQGSLIKIVDEDKKFERSKIKIGDILKLLDKEGWINLSTGEGNTTVIIEGKDVRIFQPSITINYIEKESEPIWVVTGGKGRYYSLYTINGNTGKVEKTEEKIKVRK